MVVTLPSHNDFAKTIRDGIQEKLGITDAELRELAYKDDYIGQVVYTTSRNCDILTQVGGVDKTLPLIDDAIMRVSDHIGRPKPKSRPVKVDVAAKGSGQQAGKHPLNIHPAAQCQGTYCPFHRPSNHHMKRWPKNVRLDRRALVERFCTHGVGHPDPDSISYFVRKGVKYIGIHGCDGCCDPRAGQEN